MLTIVDRECRTLGVPLAALKREGPTTCITFLGILINTVAGQLRLPPEKLSRLHGLLQEWGDRKSFTRKELESLVGHLNHACKVVRSGRSFLRRMFHLLHAVKLPFHSSARMRLSRGFHSDLAWWQEFVLQWNGVSFLLPPPTCLGSTCPLTPPARGVAGRGISHAGCKYSGDLNPSLSQSRRRNWYRSSWPATCGAEPGRAGESAAIATIR